jgi:hypothetical protein
MSEDWQDDYEVYFEKNLGIGSRNLFNGTK